MNQAVRINNKSYIRGRLVRDPVFSVAKDGSGRKMAFGRVAVDTPYVSPTGDQRVRTVYFNLKVFNPDLAEKLERDGAVKGCMVEAEGNVDQEKVEYEERESGETKTSFNVVLNVDTTEGHTVSIESFPRGDGKTN